MSTTIVNGRGVTVPAVTLRFASGARRVAARTLVEPDEYGIPMKVAGLDPEGRIVVHYYPDSDDGGWRFGLTLCCDASDKEIETGVVCRCCYGTKPNADTGEYDATPVDAYVGFDD